MLNAHFAEITLKGKNRRLFEDILIRNIKRQLGPDAEVAKRHSRILVKAPHEEQAKEALLRVFGIDSVSTSIEAEPDIESMKQAAIKGSAGVNGTLKVETKRADKRFPMTSLQISREVGTALATAGCAIDIRNPQTVVHVEVLPDRALISFGRQRGVGGLPYGTSGKVLSLLSGGIDSPVSSYMMMKRGCAVEFLHVHSFAENEDAHGSKIVEVLKRLRRYSPSRFILHLAPYSEFYKRTMDLDPRKELVVFRRFLLRLASGLAAKRRCKAIVTGDSLGQVASQTLDNLYATDEAAGIPVFRPLIGLNKQEIVDLSEMIGTYDPSIGPYKDCCSLVAHRSPSTKVDLEDAKKIDDGIKMEDIVERTLAKCGSIEV